MNWYKIVTAAIPHCIGRLNGRLQQYADELRRIVPIAENLYGGYNGSIAVVVKELNQTVHMRKPNDESNGDMIVAVLRPYGSRTQCITCMFRRSPTHPTAPQPFTPTALRVDRVVSYDQFVSDVQKHQQKAAPPKQTSPKPVTQPPPKQEVKPETATDVPAGIPSIAQSGGMYKQAVEGLPIKHKHLVVRAETSKVPSDAAELKEWVKELIEKIGMEILSGPHVSYVEDPGNKGFTTVTIIKTSHVSLHVWDEPNPYLMQLDVYSCHNFDPNKVFEHFKKWEPTKVSYKFLNRENGLHEINLGWNFKRN